MELIPFGNTGLVVSRLGFGTGQIGGDKMTDDEAGHILNHVLDTGVTLLDTARGYGLAEERIGKTVSNRRSEFVLSTKVGYGVDGYTDWSPEIISAGIERALRLMKTDVLDIVHLHSCPLQVLRESGVPEALVKAKEAGKIRVAAYSGENEALEWAVDCGLFGSIQTSINVCDQLSMNKWVPLAATSGLGVIAKRPIANAFWRFETCPVGDYAEEYWVRAQAMALAPTDLNWNDWALRFAAFAPGVCTSIVGTKNMAHFDANVEALSAGPLPDEVVVQIRSGFDSTWPGQV